MIRKYTSNSGVTLEVGDFYGSGPDEVITSLEENDYQLRINTNLNFYDLTLKPGDYLSEGDGAGRVIKNRHDDTETPVD